MDEAAHSQGVAGIYTRRTDAVVYDRSGLQKIERFAHLLRNGALEFRQAYMREVNVTDEEIRISGSNPGEGHIVRSWENPARSSFFSGRLVRPRGIEPLFAP